MTSMNNVKSAVSGFLNRSNSSYAVETAESVRSTAGESIEMKKATYRKS